MARRGAKTAVAGGATASEEIAPGPRCLPRRRSSLLLAPRQQPRRGPLLVAQSADPAKVTIDLPRRIAPPETLEQMLAPLRVQRRPAQLGGITRSSLPFAMSKLTHDAPDEIRLGSAGSALALAARGVVAVGHPDANATHRPIRCQRAAPLHPVAHPGLRFGLPLRSPSEPKRKSAGGTNALVR